MFVTLRDESGRSLKSIELFGDKVDRVVDFAEGGKVADFAGKSVVVDFDLFDADLYSFRFTDKVCDKPTVRTAHGDVTEDNVR